ncbi:MAG: HAMP domain-containing histidine kinase [Nitrospirae bacterium]|nr:HAMP domain-containing histidine kinase [Nitrospirota bacterium]
MRTKLFVAFILIISLALLSNIVFERLIIEDFNDYIRGTEEDHIYWIMASVEGSYKDGQWDKALLGEALHWGMMLGLETYVEDISNAKILSSAEVYSTMHSTMLHRMDSLLKLPSGVGEFNWYPLYVSGEEIGMLYVRPLEKLGLMPLREEIFRKRGREFLVMSFLIAGGGALILSVLFSMFLSNPIRRLTKSAEKIAEGDFSAHGPVANKKLKDEIDKLTDTFNYMAEALRREDSLRKHLTSNIAHELRTPLTVIKGNLEAIEDGIISDPNIVIRNINLEIERIISLVEGIEDITRAEASFFKKGNLEEIDLKEFIEGNAEGMKKLIEGKGLYLKMEGPLMSVETYPEKLHIILKNLLTNAYKFTESGGITIAWGDGRIEEGRGFYITVEDTGKGIAGSELMKIFDRFYKGENSGGKGLGLAIVKELAGVIGGKVEVESVLDKGTKFTINF